MAAVVSMLFNVMSISSEADGWELVVVHALRASLLLVTCMVLLI